MWFKGRDEKRSVAVCQTPPWCLKNFLISTVFTWPWALPLSLLTPLISSASLYLLSCSSDLKSSTTLFHLQLRKDFNCKRKKNSLYTKHSVHIQHYQYNEHNVLKTPKWWNDGVIRINQQFTGLLLSFHGHVLVFIHWLYKILYC